MSSDGMKFIVLYDGYLLFDLFFSRSPQHPVDTSLKVLTWVGGVWVKGVSQEIQSAFHR
jgi:hypothetical protein